MHRLPHHATRGKHQSVSRVSLAPPPAASQAAMTSALPPGSAGPTAAHERAGTPESARSSPAGCTAAAAVLRAAPAAAVAAPLSAPAGARGRLANANRRRGSSSTRAPSTLLLRAWIARPTCGGESAQALRHMHGVQHGRRACAGRFCKCGIVVSGCLACAPVLQACTWSTCVRFGGRSAAPHLACVVGWQKVGGLGSILRGPTSSGMPKHLTRVSELRSPAVHTSSACVRRCASSSSTAPASGPPALCACACAVTTQSSACGECQVLSGHFKHRGRTRPANRPRWQSAPGAAPSSALGKRLPTRRRGPRPCQGVYTGGCEQHLVP